MRQMLVNIIAFGAIATGLYAQAPGDNGILSAGTTQRINDNRMKVGLFVHGAYNMHVADFLRLPGVPCCSPGFSNGGGFGFDLGLMGSLPLSDKWLVSLRAGFSTLDGTLETEESRTVSLFGETAQGTFLHTLDISIPTATVDLLVGFRPVDRLTILLGPTASIALSQSFEQREDIIAPAVGTFENGERTRLNDTGDILGARTLLPALTLGVSYDIPLDANHTWYLIPEAMFSYGFSDINDSLSWKVNRLRVGVTLAYSPPEVRPVMTSNKFLSGEISAVGLEADGTERPRFTMRVEEFLSTRMKPILPFVFFDDGSSVIPARYTRRSKSSVQTFRELDLHDASMLETYHDLLNIVGLRMTEMPNATITLTGYHAGKGADASGQQEISVPRAEVVRQYLVEVWSINKDRIKVEGRGLPSVTSNEDEQDGIDENRRVEISSDELRILDPVWTTDTSRSVNPPSVRFKGLANAEAGLEEWRVNVTQDGEALKSFSGAGPVPTMVDWDVENDQQHVPRAPSQLDYSLYLRDNDGQEYEAKGRPMTVEQITIQKKRRERIKDKEIDRYALIAFDYSGSKVTPQQARLLDRLKQKVSLASTIRIAGHTDRTGETAFNKKLSMERSQNVASYLKGGEMTSEGYGEASSPYTNDLPEGRFYNRTVNIVVENPLSE
ncbi:MAG: OmpA family protein [bacterium]|nr:OmpA family protein [bacterium]